ncbi:Mitochondrial import inner membrane translocase subunit TIM23-3 [Acorus calamus]|uniref:Mitochondrial import inner membrane translocase subunit TIM23-3 n=1 Tax=Acorus calamus TaxID=4465 RepID=A0AAV9EI79_ACOCL|nr:Mitochondrial import inner membrane translocase subunit TIM23-3 [Acorus calamus]
MDPRSRPHLIGRIRSRLGAANGRCGRDVGRPTLLKRTPPLEHHYFCKENFVFYTRYVFGPLSGGTKGLFDAVRGEEEINGWDRLDEEITKLRVTRLINVSQSVSCRIGNSLNMIRLLSASFYGEIHIMYDVDDTVNSILAGLRTEMLYKLASGERSAIVAGL